MTSYQVWFIVMVSIVCATIIVCKLIDIDNRKRNRK